MYVRLSPDQEEFIRRTVEKGRYGKAEDVVREALAMLQERERKRSEILEAVDFAEISISRAAGGGLPQPATSAPRGKTKRGGRRKRVAAVRKA
jgi:putative addiction module CopG family antidote